MDIEQISKKKKRERTEEEQDFFIKYKKKLHNEKQRMKKMVVHEINNIEVIQPEPVKEAPQPEPVKEAPQPEPIKEEPVEEEDSEVISKEDVDEYVKYCLEFEREKLKSEIKQEVPTSSEPSFLEQIARSAIMQMTNILVPVGLALTLNYLPTGMPSSVTGSVAPTSTSNPLPVKPDMFAGQLFQ